MPPANSPNDTRPSTPPAGQRTEDHISSNLYLRQLEEAISTPVPDLASTLNLQLSEPLSEPRNASPRGTGVRSRTVEIWDGRSVLHLSREDDSLGGPISQTTEQELETDYLLRRSSRDHASRRPYLTESEFQNWTTEGRRRLMTQSQRYRDDFANRSVQLSRESSETVGSGPVRQRLHDWASTRLAERRPNENDPSDEVGQRRSTPGDAASRRELDRALRSYRIARNNLRSGRNSATDIGPVPTASALRAYWNEEATENTNDVGVAVGATSTVALNDLLEQHRTERQRRHIELARLHAERRLTQVQPSSNSISHNGIIYSTANYPAEPSRYSTLPAYHRELRQSDAFPRVRNTLHYMSGLRETSVQGGLELAKSLNLDPLYESPDATTPSDLPMTIDSLPKPQPSSWLQPGMVWHGLQSTDREPTPPPTLASTLRRERQHEYLRRSLTRRAVPIDDGNEDSADILEESRLMVQLPEIDSPNLESERVLSELLRNEPAPELDREDSRHHTAGDSTDADHWPVVVTLHEVNFDNMTVAGTMAASQIPDKLVSAQARRQQKDESSPSETETGKSMESFFRGEIVDFRHHTLESEGKTFNYRVGGVDVDARYWARLEPFKQEIDKASIGRRLTQSSSTATPGTHHEKAGNSSLDTDDYQPGAVEEKAARDIETDEIMARCLGSRKWIEEKLGNEWVLMRWKEKCFVNPIKSTPSPSTNHADPDSYPAYNNHRHQSSSSATTLTPTNQSQYYTTENPPNSAQQYTSWGLTISGFYYIALNRLTGQIDGLYYDPGSQPYQALKMVPLGSQLRGSIKSTSPQTHTVAAELPAESNGEAHLDRDGGRKVLVEAKEDLSSANTSRSPLLSSSSSLIEFAGKSPLGKPGGCRKWFPAVEFR